MLLPFVRSLDIHPSLKYTSGKPHDVQKEKCLQKAKKYVLPHNRSRLSFQKALFFN